ncbi:Uncharacterised protein [Cedecea neteri]|uniref:Uncharacterized protein n=1 Tax=Cedecea neteri TaxID=158822 RepID=A0A2X2T3G7_9ENTR|nr:Uncharacterised protein [Cedecea neteri]
MKPTMMTYIHEEQATLSAMIARYPSDLPVLQGQKEWLVLATGSSINAIKSAKYYVEKLADVRITVKEPFHFQHYEKFSETADLVLGVFPEWGKHLDHQRDPAYSSDSRGKNAGHHQQDGQ